MRTQTLSTIALAAVLALTFAACGDDDNGTPAGPSNGGGGTGTVAATITISSAGAVSPGDVTVPAGSRVTFTNNDNEPHLMASDPHPTHTLCPELNSVGLLQPNQSRTSGNLNTPRNCSYHDHNNPDDAGLQGVIRVQ